MNKENEILILDGPSDILSLLEDEFGEDYLDEDLKSFRKWFRISPKKNIYIIYFNDQYKRKLCFNDDCDHMSCLADKIKTKIESIDSKAVVKYSRYCTEHIDGIGQYLFINHSGTDGCIKTLKEIMT